MTEFVSWPEVRVSALFAGRLARDIDSFSPTHIVSLIDPDLEDHRRPVLPGHAAVIQRPFWDVETPMAEAADAETAAALVDFLSDWAIAPESRLLVHCHMGVSRSTARRMWRWRSPRGRGARRRRSSACWR